MSNTYDRAQQEEKEQRRWVKVGHLLEWGLASDIERAGGILLGLGMRITPEDVLLTLRVSFEKRPMVAFVSAVDPARAVAKAARELAAGTLRWKEDKWAKGVA